MTAINIAVVPDGSAGFVLTDSACYDGDGIITGFHAKTVTLPHIRTVIASRGHAVMCRHIAEAAQDFAGLDEIIEGLPAALRLAVPLLKPVIGDCSADINIIGFSEASQSIEGWVSYAGEQPTYEFTEVSVSLGPLLNTNQLRSAGCAATDAGLVLDNPPAVLMKVLQAQRAMPTEAIEGQGGPLVHVIGGHAVLTIVTAKGITQQVLHRWQDHLGEKISVI